MNAIRSFIAIDLPDEIQQKLDDVEQQLISPATRSIRWVPPKNIHLTLKFLGDISPANLQVLCKILDSETKRLTPFEITIEGIGAFPNSRRPRVVWVGVIAPAFLDHLQHSIDQETQRLGYPSEERAFSPHLTLGRVSHNALPGDIQQIAEKLAQVHVGQLGKVCIQHVRLFRSELLPGGAVYTPLHTSSLRT